MAIVGHDQTCCDIAEALGIKHCRKLVLRMEVNEPVIVEAEYYPEKDGLKALVPILKQFMLVEKP